MATKSAPAALLELSIDQIRVPERLREIDADYVDALVTSIREQGFTSRLLVRPAREVTKNNTWGKAVPEIFDLVAGAHRLAAAKLSGLQAVPIELRDPATPDEARLLEIDENLIRRELNPLDRAVFLAERKAVYERLYPETRNGAQGGRGGRTNENGTMTFSKSTAERLGISASTIERAVRIANRIPPELRRQIARERLIEKQAELLALADLEPDLQGAIVKRLSAGTAKSVADAIASIGGRNITPPDAATAQRRKLQEAWTRAAAPVRRRFIEELLVEGEIPAEWLDLPTEEEAA